MAYLLLDDGFAEHTKLCSVSVSARWFHVAALCYCARNLTDGHVDKRAVKVVAAVCEMNASRCTTQLVAAGLWRPDEAGNGFWIHDYLKHNPSKTKVAADREAARDRQARWRESHRDDGGRFTESNASHNEIRNALRDALSNATPSHPIPSPVIQSLSPTSYEGTDFTPMGKLKHACRAHGEDANKLERAARGCSEAALIAALAACKGPGVRDRLAVALSELKKRRNAA